MKVLYLTNIPSPYRVDFFNELGKQCELTVLFERSEAINRENKWLKKKNNNKYKSVWLKGKRIKEDSAISFGVLKYLNKKDYDIIIVGGYSTPTSMLAINYMKFKKIPFGINADGAFIKKNENLLKKIIKKHHISSAKFWICSGKITVNFFEYYGANSTQIYTYPFTSLLNRDILSAQFGEKIRRKHKKKLNINSEKVILSIGQFIHRKGFDILLEAAHRLPKEYGIYIIGGNPTKQYLELQKKLVNNNVHFIGFKTKNELKEYYAASDLFVLPTREDIWGLVINEAMANALPVITTDRCIAGLELIKNNENGLIIPIDDSEALTKGIISILEDENIMKEMGLRSLKIIQKYTIENMAQEHISIFKEILREIKK